MKKRSSYRPREVNRDPLGYFAKLPKDDRVVIDTRNHTSLERILKGEGTIADWDEVTAALNMGIVLDLQVYGGEYNAVFRSASDAHATCGLRIKDNRAVYTGPELVAVKLAMEIHDQQMLQATTKEIDTAIREAHRLFKAGHLNAIQKAARIAEAA